MSRLDEWRKELDEKTMQAVYEDRHSAKLFNGFGPKEVGEVELPITKVTSKTLSIIKEAQDLTIEALNYYTKDEILGKLEEIKKTIKPGLTEEEVNTKLEGYYTKPTVDGKIEEVEGKVDEKLSNYYTIPQTDNKLKEYYTKPDVDLKLNNYYKKHEVDLKDVEIRENVKETILNTNELSHYYTKEKTNDLLDDLYGNFMFYYKKEEVDQLLADYYTKPEVDNKLSRYYTKPEVDNKLSSYYTILEVVDLVDDLYGNFMFYYKKEEVDQLLADLEIPEVDLSDYYTKPEVDTKFNDLEIPEVDLSDYYTKPEVDDKLETIDLSNDKIIKIIEDKYKLTEVRWHYYVMLDKNKGPNYQNLNRIHNSATSHPITPGLALFADFQMRAEDKYTYEEKQYKYLGYIYGNIYYPRESLFTDLYITIPNIRNMPLRAYTEIQLVYEELPPKPAT